MSASRSPTLRPARASATARFTDTVDFPTPPFPEDTAMTFLTPGRSGVPPGGGMFTGEDMTGSGDHRLQTPLVFTAGIGADDLVDHLTVLEDEDRGDAPDRVLHGEIRVRIDVHLRH